MLVGHALLGLVESSEKRLGGLRKTQKTSKAGIFLKFAFGDFFCDRKEAVKRFTRFHAWIVLRKPA
jgi:hypothetical protein